MDLYTVVSEVYKDFSSLLTTNRESNETAKDYELILHTRAARSDDFIINASFVCVLLQEKS